MLGHEAFGKSKYYVYFQSMYSITYSPVVLIFFLVGNPFERINQFSHSLQSP